MLGTIGIANQPLRAKELLRGYPLALGHHGRGLLRLLSGELPRRPPGAHQRSHQLGITALQLRAHRQHIHHLTGNLTGTEQHPPARIRRQPIAVGGVSDHGVEHPALQLGHQSLGPVVAELEISQPQALTLHGAQQHEFAEHAALQPHPLPFELGHGTPASRRHHLISAVRRIEDQHDHGAASRHLTADGDRLRQGGGDRFHITAAEGTPLILQGAELIHLQAIALITIQPLAAGQIEVFVSRPIHNRQPHLAPGRRQGP